MDELYTALALAQAARYVGAFVVDKQVLPGVPDLTSTPDRRTLQMKRQSIEEYQRERRERQREIAAATLPVTRTSPGDEDRKQRALAHGLECMRRIKGDQTWEDWLGIGEAMMVITEEAMAEVGVAAWDGNNKRLTKEFMSRWEEYERRGTNDPRQKPLSKQERWALREVMTNPDIGAWRSSLDGTNRRKLNHPNKVIESWKRNTQTSDREPKKPSPSMSQALKERGKVIAEQEARIKELEEEAEGKVAAPQTVDQLWAAIIKLLQDEPAKALKSTITRLSAELSTAWNERRRAGVPAREEKLPKQKKGKGKRSKVIGHIKGIGDVVMED
jgi:hypothetical protein